jgi:phosphomannomutase
MLLTEYDIRGIFKKDLTLEIIYNVVQQFFQKLKIKKALLAVDFNKNNWLIKNFLEKNFPFEFLGILPTPIFYYEVIKRKKPGIMITASHLPLKYSGLKFILENGESWKPTKLPELNDRIKYPNKKPNKNLEFGQDSGSSLGPYSGNKNIFGQHSGKRIFNNYFNHLQKIIKPKKKIYVSFDKKNFFLNSSLPYFQKLKIYDIDRIYPNNNRIEYPNRRPNDKLFGKNSGKKFGPHSGKKNIFGQYSGRLPLIKIKSDFDNDRIFVFAGRKIHNDLIFYFLAKLLQYQKLGVPIFFSQKLKNELLKIGKKIYFIPTGHYFFKKAFRKYKLDLAFEPTGHFYMFKDLKTEGPYLALGLFLHSITDLNNILKFNLSLQLYRFDVDAPALPVGRELRTLHQSKARCGVALNPCSALVQGRLEKLVSSLQKKFKLKLKRFDGYLLYNQDFYLHLRRSKTENKIRVSYEGSKKYLKEIKKWLMKI